MNRKDNMTQIKIFTETTYSGQAAGPNAPRIDDLQKIVNDFLSENADKIIVKDIKYSVQSPNPNNISTKNWIVMIVYELK